MTLVTGTPVGSVVEQEGISLEGSAYVYFQNALAPLYHRPDSNGFYWGLASTGSYGISLLGCVQDVSFGDDVTVNAIRCDTVGDKDVIQKRNHLELTFTLLSLFPLSILSPIMRGGAVTLDAVAHTESMGIGPINNNVNYHVYLPKVYDDDAGDYVAITMHKCKFVDAWNIAMKSGEPWQMTGVKIWGMADTALPSAQQFATIIRADASAL